MNVVCMDSGHPKGPMSDKVRGEVVFYASKICPRREDVPGGVHHDIRVV